jgi:Na+:H+ antiporter
MDLLDTLRDHVLALPDLAKFAVVIAVMVGVPPIARRRLRLPEMIGLLLFGVLLGPHGLECVGFRGLSSHPSRRVA